MILPARFLLLASLPLIGVACSRPIRSGALIDAYRTATCVEPIFVRSIEPPVRGWDANVVVSGGANARIQGRTMVWGEITIRFDADGREVVAVDPGDYIYPRDVRLNGAKDRLYVKASGAAAGIWEETWLYEYDLRHRRQLRKNRVQPAALPPECAIGQK